MANNSLYIGNLTACSNPQVDDKLVIISNTNANVQNVTIDNFFTNASGVSITANNLTATVVTGNTLNANITNTNIIVVSTNTTPANSSDLSPEILPNSIWSDGTYLYYYNGATIKRVLITTF